MNSTPRSLAHLATPGRALLATLALALAAGVVQTSNAAGPDGPGAGGMRHEMMGGHGGMGHMGGMGGMGAMHEGRGMDRMLAAVKATPEQRTQLKPIAEALRADMKALHESGAKLHEQGAALFTQPTVDANAVEVHRQQMLAHHDQVSKRMSQAMIDMSRVLTPEQRKTLADRMSMRREMMQHRHGGAAKS
ncbi:Spy/CpxP family protein refolding chaperone [Rubrivivax sp. A210]|uniref:Spy/CpxP family protein refolding chaperone n=1 Tax=Rubrivivax sp. A210 TaxID=2772301 RepID=UPI00191AEEEB|nr:Spy/CpxP family protein refolding chaperone [Rubrivivax sp. A210]